MAWDESRHNLENPPQEKWHKLWRDIDLNMSLNPITNDVTTVTDINAVKRTIKNLLATQHHERPFHPEIGSAIQHLLFEDMGEITALRMKKTIEEVLANNNDGQFEVNAVHCVPREDQGEYNIIIHFYVLNVSSEEQTVSTILEVA
tara:strand:- start:547 stop:984 length:438 start_codon:yes stop_codon:yes gene_type:complete